MVIIIKLVLIIAGCYCLFEAYRIASSRLQLFDSRIYDSSLKEVRIFRQHSPRVIWPSLLLSIGHGVFLIILGIHGI